MKTSVPFENGAVHAKFRDRKQLAPDKVTFVQAWRHRYIPHSSVMLKKCAFFFNFLYFFVL